MNLPRISGLKISSLQFKVLLIVAAALLISTVVSVASLSRLFAATRELERIGREDFDTQLGIARAGNAFQGEVRAWNMLLLRGGAADEIEAAWAGVTTQEKLAQAFASDARTATSNAEVRERLDQFLAAQKSVGERYRSLVDVFRKSGFDAQAGQNAAGSMGLDPMNPLDEAASRAQESGNGAMQEAVRGAENVFRIAIAATALATLAALIAVWLVVRRAVLRPIGHAAAFAARIAEGDLTAEIHAASRDEAGRLIQALARMSAALSAVVRRVRTGAESVATASDQVAMGTTDLSQRTEEQASSLEETAASMEELSSTVRQNAEAAQEADELARSASKRAEQGGSEVVRAVETMGEIGASAAKIADIISVIDAIAFQTNILALNAAVEAARAGEQGRGFAVVASEVRALAQRSADAAKEIKGLIGDSVSKAQNGMRQVEQAGDTIQALVVDVKRVSDLMGSIAEASAEQSRGVQQVNKTVTEMDKVVQQNASAVQQSAAAAQAMRHEAQALLEAVSAFHLAPATDGSRAAQVPRHEPPRSLGAAKPVGAAAAPAPAAAMALAGGAGEEWEEF